MYLVVYIYWCQEYLIIFSNSVRTPVRTSHFTKTLPFFSPVMIIITMMMMIMMTMMMITTIIIIMIIKIINLIYIVEFDTNDILTALYIVIQYTQTQYMHVHKTIMFVHVYMSTHVYTDTHKKAQKHTNKIAHTHITSLPVLLHIHVCIGIYART